MIKEKRKEKKYTQEDMARLLGISLRQYVRIDTEEDLPRRDVLKKLIEIFTDEGDIVIDPVAGSGSTLKACKQLNRSCYGFEIDRNFYNKAISEMLEESKV